MMTGPQADFCFPVRVETASYTGQWYSENTMQGILAYRGQVTQALGLCKGKQVERLRDHRARWCDDAHYDGQLMAIFIDDNKDSANNQPGLIGFEIESEPCKISVRDIWLRKFD